MLKVKESSDPMQHSTDDTEALLHEKYKYVKGLLAKNIIVYFLDTDSSVL